MRTFLKICLICFGCALIAAPTQAQDINLLNNPGFENPFPQQQYDSIAVAAGWTAWWMEPDSSPAFPSYCDYSVAPPSCQPYHRPEYGMAWPYGERIRSGGNAQKYFSFFSTHLAGLYQQVTGVVPGQAYRFSVYVMTWSTDQDKGFTSAIQPSMGVQVGIDPNGGTDPFNANIVFSPSQNAFDVWTPVGVDAVAKSSTITVFTRSWPQLALKHDDVYLDDASLIAVAGGTDLLPTSPPSLTTASTAQGITVVAPTPLFAFTSTPLPNGEIWYMVQPGDTLGRIAYYHQTTVDEIKQLNDLKSNVIYSNQKLRVKIVAPPAAFTNTPAVTLTPSATPLIVAPATSTPVPFALSPDYGQLCVVAYNDANRNATNDAEPTLAEVQMTLKVSDSVLNGYVTTGSETNHCFPQLPSGTYTVAVVAPPGYTSTTATEATVQLQAGNLVTLAFGLAATTGSPSSLPASTTPTPGNTLLLIGLGVAVVVLTGLGAVAVLLVKKK